MDAVVAVFSDWGIGRNGTQSVVLHADRKHFRDVTAGSAVIVGRKTLEDFPGGKPLKGRSNIVITRQDIEIPGAAVAHDTVSALELAALYPQCIVIGGASIYKQFFPYTDRVFLTKIDVAPESDSYFPNLDGLDDWKCTEQGEWQEEEGVRYCFCTYERIKTGGEK